MRLTDIALRNLIRRKAKAGFVLAGLLIGISTVVGLITLADTMSHDINHKLEKYGANILIVPKTENLSLSYGGLSLGGVSFEMEEIRQTELDSIGTIKNAANIAAVGPLVLGVVDIDKNKALVAGVDFDAVGVLKPWWRLKGAFPRQNEALLGSQASRILGLNRGDPLVVAGHHLIVSGVLQPTGSQDDQLVFTQLATAQAILGKEGRISMAEVAALCKDCPIHAMVKQISDVLPGAQVMAIQQVVKGRMETLAKFKKFSYFISCVVILVGGLVVLVTMMGSVRERTAEIGVLRAMGFRKSHVMGIIFSEAAVVSSLAGILGYFVGFAVTKGALLVFSDMHQVTVPLNVPLAAMAFALAVITGLLSSAYPAFLATRMDPNDALRAM